MVMAPPASPQTPTGNAEELLRFLAEAVEERRQKAALGIGFKHDTGASPIVTGYSHGPGGNLSFPGVDQDVFHTVVGNKGILGQLAVKPSTFTNPTYQVITGVQDTTGDEKDGVCDDAPVAGLIKSCMLTSVFGRYERATQELEINRLGQQNDRADPMDLRMVGSPIHTSGLFATGPGDPTVPGDLLQNETARKFWELGIAFHRLINQQLWTGTPANNAAGGGSKELTGFQVLVNTGHQDAETGTSCPSVDSDLKDFNFKSVADNGQLIVEALSAMLHFVMDLAERTGVNPVRWVWAMRPELFWELTSIWPCSYLTYRCELANISGAVVNIDGAEQVRMRDELRAGRFLLIDGVRIEVVLDDGIPEVTATENGNVTEGCFSSDIYLIPMSVVGGQAVTFLEHFQYQNPSINDAMAGMILGRIEGPWITWPRQTNLCVQWQSKIEPRLVMRTPWLAGRLQNVMYCPVQHTRQPFPDDPYFVDGGKTSRDGPSFFNPWD